MATLVGTPRVGSVEREVSRQIGQLKQNVAAMIKRVLRQCWRRIRARMIAERLTGRAYRWWKTQDGYGGERPPAGAPLAKKTGNLIRSMGGFVNTNGDNIGLDAQIGKGAYYAEQHEDSGRLQFRRIATEEMEKAKQEVAANFAVLAKLGGARGLSAESQALVDASDAVLSPDAGRNALLQSFRGEFEARRQRSNAYQRARRAKTSGQRAFKRQTKGFGSFGVPTTFAGFTP